MSRATLLRVLRQQPARRSPPPRCSGWTTSPCANATPMARSWWTWSAASPWRCSGADRRTCGAVAARASWGGGDRTRSGECVCRGRTPGRPWRHPGGRPLPYTTEPRRSPYPRLHRRIAGALDAVNATARQQPVPLPNGTSAVPVPPPPTPPAEEARAAQRAARRHCYDRCGRCTARAGAPRLLPCRSGAAVARSSGISRCQTGPVRQHRRHYGRSIAQSLSGISPGALERRVPHRHPALQGDPTAWVRRELSPRHGLCPPHRQAQGIPPRRQGRRQPCRWWRSLSPALDTPPGDLAGPEARGQAHEAEAQQLTQLHAQAAEVAEAIDLAQDFANLVRQRQPERLDPWLSARARVR